MRNIFLLTVLTLISFVLNAQTQVPPNWFVYDQVNSSMEDERVYFLYYDSDNWIHWAATFDGGLTRVNGLDLTTFTTSNSDIPTNKLRTITVANGLLWVGTKDAGIFSLDTNTMTFTSYSPANSGMPSYESWGMTADQSGNIWTAAGSQGLAKFDGLIWTIFSTSNSGVADDWVNYVTEDAQGNIWAATAGGISKFDGIAWTTYNSGDYGRVVIQTSDGAIWMGTTTRLTRLEDGILTDFTTSNSDLPDNNVAALTEDSLGNLWIGTVAGGVAKYDGTSFEIFDMSNSTLPDNYIETIDVSNYNTPWVGTNSGGLAGFREDNQIMSSVEEINSPNSSTPALLLRPGQAFSTEINQGQALVEIRSMEGKLIFEEVMISGRKLLAPYESGLYIVRIVQHGAIKTKMISVL